MLFFIFSYQLEFDIDVSKPVCRDAPDTVFAGYPVHPYLFECY
jgi:hypothetical protein